jgi:hypothetical protein
MEHFAGLDVSMKETHVCVVDCDGDVALEAMATTLPEAIAEAPGEGTKLSAGRARDGPHGPDALSWA